MMIALHSVIRSCQNRMNSEGEHPAPGHPRPIGIEARCFDLCIGNFDTTLREAKFGLDDPVAEELFENQFDDVMEKLSLT